MLLRGGASTLNCANQFFHDGVRVRYQPTPYFGQWGILHAHAIFEVFGFQIQKEHIIGSPLEGASPLPFNTVIREPSSTFKYTCTEKKKKKTSPHPLSPNQQQEELCALAAVSAVDTHTPLSTLSMLLAGEKGEGGASRGSLTLMSFKSRRE